MQCGILPPAPPPPGHCATCLPGVSQQCHMNFTWYAPAGLQSAATSGTLAGQQMQLRSAPFYKPVTKKPGVPPLQTQHTLTILHTHTLVKWHQISMNKYKTELCFTVESLRSSQQQPVFLHRSLPYAAWALAHSDWDTAGSQATNLFVYCLGVLLRLQFIAASQAWACSFKWHL